MLMLIDAHVRFSLLAAWCATFAFALERNARVKRRTKTEQTDKQTNKPTAQTDREKGGKLERKKERAEIHPDSKNRLCSRCGVVHLFFFWFFWFGFWFVLFNFKAEEHGTEQRKMVAYNYAKIFTLERLSSSELHVLGCRSLVFV